MTGPLVDLVRVNNTRYSWTSCSFRFDMLRSRGVVACNWEQKRERKMVYAGNQSGTPLGWTAGKYTVPSFTIRMLKEWANALTDYLMVGGSIQPGLGSFGDSEWSFTAQMVEPVIGAVPLIMVAQPCCIVGKKDVHEEGIDELVTEFEIATMAITENNKRLWSAVRELIP